MSRVPESLKDAHVPDPEMVFRLVFFPEWYDPGKGHTYPTIAAFVPNRGDLQEAVDNAWTNGFGLSLWRCDLTTPNDADHFLQNTRPTAALGAVVGDIHGLRTVHGSDRLEVVATPVTERQDLAGWQGHASLFGLPCKVEPFVNTTASAKDLRDQVAQKFTARLRSPPEPRDQP